MMEGVQESLAGRVAPFQLPPLTQREILGLPNRPLVPELQELLQQTLRSSGNEVYKRLWRGSVPGHVSGAQPNRYTFYSSYLATYLQRDSRDLVKLFRVLKFNQLLRAAAARAAQVMNFDALAVDAEKTSHGQNLASDTRSSERRVLPSLISKQYP